MWSFEGDYRRKPQQRLGGASKTRNIERSDLLSQLKADRDERESQRRREAAALTLQAWARGVLSLRRTKLNLRHQFDSHLALVRAQGISEASVIRLIALLIRIFHPREDSDRLLATCQLVLREQKQLVHWVCDSCDRWMYLLPRLANMALLVITHPVQGGSTAVSHAAPLRLLEIVLAPDSWSTKLPPSHQHLFLAAVYSHLINKGYYHQIVQLLITRVPEVYEASEDPPPPSLTPCSTSSSSLSPSPPP
ncbi:Ubiquitin-protein ligase E3C [Chionoecetes opilio]|uniref:HECT-type E3 ubiquitin transferase n=1 Tax=Chionoecetes opilio TaxID=41210 RepID=A0A8J8WEJ9_CHIOP|nr:Ubiquitin-protein ligase E3C [Chionoecetes opilio]